MNSLPHALHDDAVLTVAQTAQLLGVHRITLWRKRQEADGGGLPFVRLSPGRIGYLRHDVRAYLAACRVGSLPKSSNEAAEQLAAA